jgi:hypothetical protein
VRLRREQRRLQTPWSDVWARAKLVNALGESCAATSAVEGKHTALLMAGGREEGAAAPPWIRSLMDFHSEVVRRQAAPLQIILVSFNMTLAEMVRWMRAPISKKDRQPMPWLAAPHGSPVHAALTERFHSQLRGLPTLILISSSGAVVSNTALLDVTRHGAAVWAMWRERLTNGAAMEEIPAAFDLFVDATAGVEQQLARLRVQSSSEATGGGGTERHEEAEGGEATDSGEAGSGAVGREAAVSKQPSRLLLHIGADWSEGSAVLERALEHSDAAALVKEHFVVHRLCYETCQRWLMLHLPSLHHSPLPTLAVLAADGRLISHVDVESLRAPSALDAAAVDADAVEIDEEAARGIRGELLSDFLRAAI